MTIETSWPGITNQNEAQLAAAAAYYTDHYEVAFEDDLAKMTLLHRLAGQTVGKGGVPSAKTSRKLSRVDMGAAGLEIKHFIDDPIVTIDEVARTLRLSMTSQPYRPLGVFKALVKMAVSVMDESDAARVPEALRWLRATDVTTGQIDEGTKYSCLRTFTPGPGPYPRSVVMLLRRRSCEMPGPQFVFAVAFGNLSFQNHSYENMGGHAYRCHRSPCFGRRGQDISDSACNECWFSAGRLPPLSELAWPMSPKDCGSLQSGPRGAGVPNGCAGRSGPSQR